MIQMGKKIKRSQVEDWSIDRIVPYENNAKLHSDQQIEQIVNSIEEFTFLDPIAVDEKGEILEGHGRLLAAKKRGDKTIPVIQISGLSNEQKVAYRLAHNKLTMNSGFDPELLKIDFELLEDAGFNIDLTGFDPLEIDFGDEEILLEDDDAIADLQEEAESGELRSRVSLGDVWKLGRHYIVCGDCTILDNTKALIKYAGTNACMCWTDPPYNVDYDPEQRVSSFSEERLANPIGKIANDSMSDEEFNSFLSKAYDSIDIALSPGSPIYICHADIQGHHFRNNFIKQGWKLQSCLIWLKTVLAFGRADYHWKHEPILYGWKMGASHRYYGDRTQTTILEFASPHYDKKECDTDGYVHSCQKPTPLIRYCLNNSSQKGDVIFDPFLGSASTLIASEQCDRTCIGFELSPEYCEVICQRFEKLTGIEAVKVGTIPQE